MRSSAHTHMFGEWPFNIFIYDIIVIVLMWWDDKCDAPKSIETWREKWIEGTGGLRPKIQRKSLQYARFCMSKIVDICIYVYIYYFDRVAPNYIFRGNSVRFVLEFLLILIVIVLLWKLVVCQPCSIMFRFMHSSIHDEWYPHLKTPRLDPHGFGSV